MSTERIPASVRDPSGLLFRRDGIVYRQVNPIFGDDYERMMKSGFYRSAVEAGLLVPHEELPPEDPAAVEKGLPRLPRERGAHALRSDARKSFK